MAIQVANRKTKSSSVWKRIKLDFQRNKVIYLMAIPIIAFYIIFSYMPMYGTLVAFQDYKPEKGFSKVIGLDLSGLSLLSMDHTFGGL